MRDVIRIDLPKTKYTFVPEGLLFKMSVPDFGKLLRVIGEQADPTEKPASEFYKDIRALIKEASDTYFKEYHLTEYRYTETWQEPNGYKHSKVKKVSIYHRFAQLNKKLSAAEAKWGR